MGRYRSRSRSYSPRRSRSPPRRKRYEDPRDRYRGGRSSYGDRRSAPSGLLVRNIALDARPEDLRIPFERFGPVKDVYLPKNYYTGEPRGFGFVKFRNADDAAEAKMQMNHQVIGGREITIVFAGENRKTPQEMRTNLRTSDRYGGGYRRRSPVRSPRRRHHSYSRSPSPPRRGSRDGDRGAKDDNYSPPRLRSRSRSRSRSRTRSRSISRSPPPLNGRDYRRSLSPKENGRGSPKERDYRSDHRSASPNRNGRSLSRSRSFSPR
ncbi:serine/arginine-rich SC35-like splicing factor SCL28 isoform X2 [Macadamia integrifolia]|uniref:serine/arginine-rich SC35-like splicing factor SCL28 isoform X2 n=1 Tax=Macadamia integrifolia TaxID=60698 RepID=UPI001C4EB96E|nr:serine/arginine-rich SC35-like splicing factor SCL28 isoform X2 [Macadamia integrifolia]